MFFRRLSGPARFAAILWLLSLLAAGAIMLVALGVRPAAAMGASPLDLVAPAGRPVGLLVALASITGAAIVGCVGSLMLCRIGRPLPRKRI